VSAGCNPVPDFLRFGAFPPQLGGRYCPTRPVSVPAGTTDLMTDWRHRGHAQPNRRPFDIELRDRMLLAIAGPR